MARRRRRKHEQLTLLNKAGTKKRDPRGGKRRGRKPNNGVRAGMSHDARASLVASYPLHVTLVLPIVSTLRDFDIYPAFEKATIAAAKYGQHMEDDQWFRIVHLSIQSNQSNHVHLLVEASDRDALSRGLQSFEISAAKWINRAVSKRFKRRRRGGVFADRYHDEPIKSPLQARRALTYVLNNWRKHERDRTKTSSTWRVDPFSSGVLFTGWQELADRGVARWDIPEGYVPLTVLEPRTWLLRVGWRRHGLVPCSEVPSERLFAHA